MEVFFYVIIAIIYVIFSLAAGNKKKNANQKNQNTQTSNPQADREKIAEIIKKLTQQNQPVSTDKPISSEINTEFSKSSETYTSETAYPVKDYDLEAETYEEAELDEDVYDYDYEDEQAEQKKLKERLQLKYNRPVSKMPQKKEFAKKDNPFKKILQNKEDLKNAYIVSEIFKTKF